MMTATELQTFDKLLHDAKTVDLALDMLLQEEEITKDIMSIVHKAFADWLDVRHNELPNYQDWNHITDILYKLKCVFRGKEFRGEGLVEIRSHLCKL